MWFTNNILATTTEQEEQIRKIDKLYIISKNNKISMTKAKLIRFNSYYHKYDT